jgi:type I restriction enzyme S subunit
LTQIICPIYASQISEGGSIPHIKQTTGIQNLDCSSYLGQDFNFPAPEKQRQIAAYLDAVAGKIDRLVALRRRQMELLREQRAALIQQAVTRGLDSNVPLKESGLPWLGKIPGHWEVVVQNMKPL